MRLTAEFARMGPGGVAVCAAAVATVIGAIGFAPGTGVGLMQLWGVTLALVLALTRVAVPVMLRFLLIAMLLGAMFGLSITSDPMTANATVVRVEREQAERQAERLRIEQAATSRTSMRRGARIQLAGGAWATRIQALLDGTLGGPSAGTLAILGAAATGEGSDRVAVVWSIGRDDVRIACGTTTISGGDEATTVGALSDSFGRAIAATLAGGGQPRCV